MFKYKCNYYLNILSKNKLEFLLILCYLVLPYIFFKDSLNINSVILGTGDPTAIVLPLRELITKLIKNGEIPFWNIFNFSGYPLLAYNEAGLFYPITLIFNLVFPVHLAHNLSILLHYSLAGIFMHLFLREYRLNIFSRFTGGIIFMFSGIAITHRSHPNILYTLVWLPLILFFLIKYRKSKNLNFLFICSIFYSISFFAGHTQIFFYLSLIVLIFILFYALIYEGKKGLFFLRALFIFVICIFIISIQLIPTIELMFNSTRSSISYEYFSSFSFDFKLIPILLFPYIYGNSFFQYQDVPSYFGPWNYNEMVIYFGVATIPLLIIGLFSKNKHKFLWIFILIVSFILVLGDKTPIYKLFFHIPIYNKFRVPTRNWFEFGFSFSILSAFGIDHIITNSREKLTKNIFKILILIFSILLVMTIFFVIRGKYLLKEKMISELFQNLKITNYSIFVPVILISSTIIFLSLFLKYNKKILYIAFIFLIFFDLFSMGHFYESNSDIKHLKAKFEEKQDLKFLKNNDEQFRIFPIAPSVSNLVLTNNKNIHLDVPTITGTSALFLKDYSYITGIRESSDYIPNWMELIKNNHILTMLNTKYIILNKPENIEDFLQNIEKRYYKKITNILDSDNYNNVYLTNISFDKLTGEFIFNGSEGIISFLESEADIEPHSNYLISFDIYEAEKISKDIFIGFINKSSKTIGDSGRDYFQINTESIGSYYKNISRVIETSSFKDNKINFIIKTNGAGLFKIKNLKIEKVNLVSTVQNYDIQYQTDNKIILKNNNYLPRFYFVDEVSEINGIEEAKKILWNEPIFISEDIFIPNKCALVESPEFDQRHFVNESAKIDIGTYKNNYVKLNISSKNDAFLVFSDNYYPGWRAFIDNERTKIYRVNGILKGIFIPEGTHEVVFNYFPNSFFIGLALSCLSLLILLLYFSIRLKK